MPELPEVETIKRDLQKLIIKRTISSVDVIEPKSIRNRSSFFKKKLTGSHFVSIGRKGKLLIMELSSSDFLLARLGMTGQLIYCQKNLPGKHTRVAINFQNGSKLFFNDIRKFGYLFLATKLEKDSILKNIGIDPLDNGFNLGYFKDLIGNKKGALKAFLLDQKMVSGIGNIYADEICFDSRLKPDKNIRNLNDNEVKRLYNSIIKILDLAIKKRGTTFSDYVDASGKKGRFFDCLKVYGKEKNECARCKIKSIKKIKVAGRSTRFCEYCQK